MTVNTGDEPPALLAEMSDDRRPVAWLLMVRPATSTPAKDSRRKRNKTQPGAAGSLQ